VREAAAPRRRGKSCLCPNGMSYERPRAACKNNLREKRNEKANERGAFRKRSIQFGEQDRKRKGKGELVQAGTPRSKRASDKKKKATAAQIYLDLNLVRGWRTLEKRETTSQHFTLQWGGNENNPPERKGLNNSPVVRNPRREKGGLLFAT